MLQMHGAMKCVCCTPGTRCYYIATLCPCETNFPGVSEEVSVPCAWVQGIVQSLPQEWFVFQVIYNPQSAPCYRVGLDSAQCFYPPQGGVDVECPPPVTLPTTPQAQWLSLSCDECCEKPPPPPFCWAIARACNIPGDPQCTTPLGETVYVPLGQQVNGQCPAPTLHIWQFAGRCIYIAPDSTVVTTIPNGAVTSPPQAQFPSCIECCGEEPPKGCPLTCDGCPPTLNITVSSWTIPFGGGITIDVTGGMVPVQRIPGTCNWESLQAVEFTAFINEPGFPPEPLPFFLSGTVACSQNDGWSATIDGSVFCAFVSNNFDPCPFAGGYNCQMPPGGCDSCPPNVSVG